MKIEEKCPNCGAQHTVTTDSAESFRMSCGCGEKYLTFDARRISGKEIRWMTRARPGSSVRPRSARGGPIVRGHTSGGRVVPKDIAEKLRKAYGGGTVTGRHSGGGPVQIKDSADGELRFIAGKELTWPKHLNWDIASPTEKEKKPPAKVRFEGHGAPDKRSRLVRQFQDVFGRDQ